MPPICCRRVARPSLPATPQPRAEAIGLHSLKDGACALGVGLAFGHAEAGALKQLAEIAMAQGARWARPAPDRTLLLGPLSEAHAIATVREAHRLGFVTEATDPRRRIVRLSRRAGLRERSDRGALACGRDRA